MNWLSEADGENYLDLGEKMFGPNTHFRYDGEISFSHRDEEFMKLFELVSGLFQEKFSLREYDILFIPGSGTVGMEAVIHSIKNKLYFPNREGKFNQRWISMAKKYSKLSYENEDSLSVGCCLETSLSRHYQEEYEIIDCISSFPYYPIKPETKVFVTCCNKQIGSFVGLSIVGVRKDCWHLFDNCEIIDENGEYSYLDLHRYKKYSSIFQTPTTTAVHIFSHLVGVLGDFNLEGHRERITTVSLELVKTIGEDNIIGDLAGPVITLSQDVIPKEISEKWSLYGGKNEGDPFQIFTYSSPINEYLDFLDDLKN